jgi:hypothetical protein
MGSCGGWKSRQVRSAQAAAQHEPDTPRVTNSPVMSGAQRAARQDRRDQAIYVDLLGATVPSSYYEIRVAGVLPPEALLDFERLTASVEPVETVVHGPLRDQAALHGLLARLETFGVQVLEVRRLYERDPSAGEASGE